MSIWRPLAIVGVLSVVAASAFAQGARTNSPGPLPRERMTTSAPEIDPAVMGGAVALLAGATFLVASRRRRKK
jgi:hypothetical protein